MDGEHQLLASEQAKAFLLRPWCAGAEKMEAPQTRLIHWAQPWRGCVETPWASSMAMGMASTPNH